MIKTENKKCKYWKVKVKSLSRVRLFATPWTVAHQAPLSMGIFQARVLESVAISFSKGGHKTMTISRLLYQLEEKAKILIRS